MRRVFALGVLLAVACGTLPSPDEPAADAGAADVATADGAASTVDAGPGSDAAASCSGGCPANAVCDDGVCLLTACASGNDVILLRPKELIDAKGTWATFPAGASILDAVRERGDGDGDQTYASGEGAGPLTLRIGPELLKVPAGRTVERVVIRARARSAAIDGGAGESASLVLAYHFRSFDGFYSQTAAPVGSGYGIVQFGLGTHPFPTYVPPKDASANQWTEERVNDVDVDLSVPIGQDAGALRLTQVWVEVCLAAAN